MRKRLTEKDKYVIVENYKNGIGCDNISKLVGCSRETIRRFINKESNQIKYVFEKREFDDILKDTKATAEKGRAKQFNEKFTEWEYVKGWSGRDGMFTIIHKECGTEIEVNGQVLKPRTKEILCKVCRDESDRIKKATNETIKTMQIYGRNELKKSRELLDEISKYSIEQTCHNCGETFHNVKRLKYCDDRCRTRRNHADKVERRNARIKQRKYDDDITLDKLIKRDNNVCQICLKECNVRDYQMKQNAFVVGKDYPSIDHVIPISKGGTHSWNNIQLAHHYCNTLKSNT